MSETTFIIYNTDRYDSQEEAIEARCATEVSVDMNDPKSASVFEQMSVALGNEAGHCDIVEKNGE